MLDSSALKPYLNTVDLLCIPHNQAKQDLDTVARVLDATILLPSINSHDTAVLPLIPDAN